MCAYLSVCWSCLSCCLWFRVHIFVHFFSAVFPDVLSHHRLWSNPRTSPLRLACSSVHRSDDTHDEAVVGACHEPNIDAVVSVDTGGQACVWDVNTGAKQMEFTVDLEKDDEVSAQNTDVVAHVVWETGTMDNGDCMDNR